MPLHAARGQEAPTFKRKTKVHTTGTAGSGKAGQAGGAAAAGGARSKTGHRHWRRHAAHEVRSPPDIAELFKSQHPESGHLLACGLNTPGP